MIRKPASQGLLNSISQILTSWSCNSNGKSPVGTEEAFPPAHRHVSLTDYAEQS